MYRLLVVIAFLALPLAKPSVGGAWQQTAVDLLPPDIFSSDWVLIGSRESGGPTGATAQFGGPNGGRIDLFWGITDGLQDEEVADAMTDLFAAFRDLYMHPERTRSVAVSELPSSPPACNTVDRFEGFELNYEFFPAGATLCIAESDERALIAYVAGEFNGLEGYRASDAVTGIVLDQIAR
jgi:hypothetical protein